MNAPANHTGAKKILSHGLGIFSLSGTPPWGFAQIFLHHHESFTVHFSRQITNAGGEEN